MKNKINEQTPSLEHSVQTTAKEHINSDTGEKPATQKDIQEIVQKIEKLQMSFDTMMDVR